MARAQSVHHGNSHNVSIGQVAVHNLRMELLNSFHEGRKRGLKTIIGTELGLNDGDAQLLEAARELTLGSENHQVKAGEPGTCHIDNVPSYSAKIGNRNDPQGRGCRGHALVNFRVRKERKDAETFVSMEICTR